MSKNGFIQLQRAAEELFEEDMDAYLLMSQIMFRARRTNSKYNKYKLRVGQALIGDYKSIGLTEQRYRDAKNRIENEHKLAKFEGNNKGTIATLLSTEFCDINADDGTKQKTNKERTKNGQGTNKTFLKLDIYDEKSIDENEQRTDKERTKNGQGTTKEECNNEIMKETTTPPTPSKGEVVVVSFYDCLTENKDLTEDEKEALMQFPEHRVKFALNFSKTEKPKTTLIQMLVWHCKEKVPPQPSGNRLTEQQKMAREFNKFLLSIGCELIYEQNNSLIEEGHYINGPFGPLSLKNDTRTLRQDFDDIRNAFRLEKQRRHG